MGSTRAEYGSEEENKITDTNNEPNENGFPAPSEENVTKLFRKRHFIKVMINTNNNNSSKINSTKHSNERPSHLYRECAAGDTLYYTWTDALGAHEISYVSCEGSHKGTRNDNEIDRILCEKTSNSQNDDALIEVVY